PARHPRPASRRQCHRRLPGPRSFPTRRSSDLCFAITGSINQFGEVQAIGGVNVKIEGFFRLCQARGLTGKQGVIIPRVNVPNLMLDKAVMDAAEEGLFHIYAVDNVDQALSLLAV